MKTLITALKNKNLTLAIAESCTAGYVSYLLTKTPGASKVFKGGVIVYSLESKNKFFKIPYSILNKTQGVSKEVALTLAKGIRKQLKTDIGAAVVGFAGPEDKKTGTVFISMVTKNKVLSRKLLLKGTRDKIRKQASHALIGLVYKELLQ
ncbi:MAG: CinA family protein [Candidatus Omnitrophota bacterium]